MNTYRIIDTPAFPELQINQTLSSVSSLVLPGFATEDTVTTIKMVDKNYYGFEYFEFQHEMLIRDTGVAFGFYEGKPIKLDFQGYKKTFTVKAYLNRSEEYVLISQTAFVVADLIKKIRGDNNLKVKINEISLELNKAKQLVTQFKGAWFRGVSSRVSSSALFGADLINEPLFAQLQNDGADLTSITIPFGAMTIQINSDAGISSHQKIASIKDELELVKNVKDELIDKLIAD